MSGFSLPGSSGNKPSTSMGPPSQSNRIQQTPTPQAFVAPTPQAVQTPSNIDSAICEWHTYVIGL